MKNLSNDTENFSRGNDFRKILLRSAVPSRLKFHFVAEVVRRPRDLYARDAYSHAAFLQGCSKFNTCEKVGLFALEKIAPVEQGVLR